MENEGWKENNVYWSKCVKVKCSNAVVMKPRVAVGYHVGVCSLCGTKVIERTDESKN